MAFPTIESITTSSSTTNDTTFGFDGPATVNSGDLLLACLANNGGDENIAVSGWTQIDHQASSGGIFALDATGSEGGGTVTATWDSNERVAGAILRITGWSGTVSDLEADFVAGPDAATTMPTLTPSHGSDDYLWVIFRSSGNSDNTVSSWPTNYTSNQTRVESSGGGATAQGVVDLATYTNAASSESPGTWTFSGNYGTANGCWLIAVRPDQGGGGGGVSIIPRVMHNRRQQGMY